MASKNTRLIYTDENNLNIYRSLPEKDFKEFMMAYLTYKKGDNIDDMFTSLTAKLLFMTYISKIEYNEDKWEKRAKVNQENGKKGGRPKKNNTDITPNTEFENEAPNEAPNKIPSFPIDEEKKEEQLNRREEQTGSKESEILSEETEGGNEEYVVEDYIDKHINKVLIPFLQKKGAEYYENLNRLTVEVKAVFPDIQLHEISSMIEDMVRIRSKKVGG